MNSVAFGSGSIKGCGFDLMFLFGEAWEVGEQRSDNLHVAGDLEGPMDVL